MKLNNKGLTLIEVIVVIAIMAVLTTTSVNAVSYVLKGDIKKATKTLYSAITSTRTNAMAKTGGWQFTVTHDGTKYSLNSVWDEIAEPFSTEVLSNRVDSITVTCSGATMNLSSIEFEKNTGAVRTIVGDAGVIYNRASSGSPLAGYADIVISISGNKQTLRLYYLTGKIEQI